MTSSDELNGLVGTEGSYQRLMINATTVGGMIVDPAMFNPLMQTPSWSGYNPLLLGSNFNTDGVSRDPVLLQR